MVIQPCSKLLPRSFPTPPSQRCLVHIQPRALIWLTRKPKTPAARALRTLIRTLLDVEDLTQAKSWENAFRK